MSFRYASASWADIEALTRRIAADEAGLRRSFWKKLRGLAARLPFAEDLIAAHYCAFDRRTPLHVKAALVGALAYFVLPADLHSRRAAGDRLHRRRRSACHRDQTRLLPHYA